MIPLPGYLHKEALHLIGRLLESLPPHFNGAMQDIDQVLEQIAVHAAWSAGDRQHMADAIVKLDGFCRNIPDNPFLQVLPPLLRAIAILTAAPGPDGKISGD